MWGGGVGGGGVCLLSACLYATQAARRRLHGGLFDQPSCELRPTAARHPPLAPCPAQTSEARQRNEAACDAACQPRGEPLATDGGDYAASSWVQLKELLGRQAVRYWRKPEYNGARGQGRLWWCVGEAAVRATCASSDVAAGSRSNRRHRLACINAPPSLLSSPSPFCPCRHPPRGGHHLCAGGGDHLLGQGHGAAEVAGRHALSWHALRRCALRRHALRRHARGAWPCSRPAAQPSPRCSRSGSRRAAQPCVHLPPPSRSVTPPLCLPLQIQPGASFTAVTNVMGMLFMSLSNLGTINMQSVLVVAAQVGGGELFGGCVSGSAGCCFKSLHVTGAPRRWPGPSWPPEPPSTPQRMHMALIGDRVHVVSFPLCRSARCCTASRPPPCTRHSRTSPPPRSSSCPGCCCKSSSSPAAATS